MSMLKGLLVDDEAVFCEAGRPEKGVDEYVLAQWLK